MQELRPKGAGASAARVLRGFALPPVGAAPEMPWKYCKFRAYLIQIVDTSAQEAEHCNRI